MSGNIAPESKAQNRAPISQAQAPAQDAEDVSPSSTLTAGFSQVSPSPNRPRFSTTPKRTSTQPKVTDFVRRKLPHNEKNKVDRAVMKLFYKDLQPFSVVEDEGMRSVFHALNPNYVVPTRKTFSKTLIPALYEETLTDLKATFSGSKVPAVTLTTDTWTSRNVEGFMAVTAHYVSPDFELKSNLLGCFPYDESHTKENLAHELKRIAVEWGIEDKILLCVSDNAYNITGAIRDVLKWKHLGCLAHSINLIVRHSLLQHNAVNDLVKKIKNVVTLFRQSSGLTAKLKEMQVQKGLQPKKLIQDVPTRWNSTYDMVERFLELEEPLKMAISVADRQVDSLSFTEWSLASSLKDILQPMKELTEILSGEKYTTGSSAFVYVDGIHDVYREMLLKAKPDDKISRSVIKDILEGIQTRFCNVAFTQTLNMSIFLDPRYKNVFFVNDTTATTIKENVQNGVARLIKDEKEQKNLPPQDELSVSPAAATASRKQPAFLDKYRKKVGTFKPAGTHLSRAILEVQRYLEEPLLENGDPLEWWKVQGYNFPYLRQLFLKKFCPISTSVPSERVFSQTGIIISERRSRISGDKVEKLVFLKFNAK